jgi:hypothetical protein
MVAQVADISRYYPGSTSSWSSSERGGDVDSDRLVAPAVALRCDRDSAGRRLTRPRALDVAFDAARADLIVRRRPGSRESLGFIFLKN